MSILLQQANINTKDEIGELSVEKASTENLITGTKLLIDKHDYGKALEVAKKALSSELNNPEVYLLISQAYKGLGSIDNAERFYQFYKLFNT